MNKKMTLAIAAFSFVASLTASPAAAESVTRAENAHQAERTGRLHTMGGKFGYRYNVRRGPGTRHAVVATVRGKGKSLPCWHNLCNGVKRTTPYICYTGGEKGNTWVPLEYEGRKVWAAQECGALGR